MTVEYTHIPLIPDAQKEALSRGLILWQDKTTKIFYPENPLVPAEEGVHLRIESRGIPQHPKTREEWHGWMEHWAKMIGAGKVVSEGADLPDMWQSFIGSSEYTPRDYLATDLIGRNPHGTSWKPTGLETAPLPNPNYDNRDKRVDSDKLEHLGAVLERFFRKDWSPALEKLSVYPEGITVYPPGSEQFQFVYDRNMKLPWPSASEPLFVAKEAEVVAILTPHLKTGIHLMIGFPDAPKRPWHNTQKALEGLALGEASGQILGMTPYEGLPLAADWSVRATGSWPAQFKEAYTDPVLHDAIFGAEAKPPKWVKRRQRGADTMLEGEGKHEWTMGIGFHPHLYVTRYPDELIRLARRPAQEGGADWEGIVVMDESKRHAMRDALNMQIPHMIQLMKGPLIQSG